MKRKITLLTTLVMSIVLIAITSSDAMAQARNRRVFDSGVITPGPNQSVRLSVATGDINSDGYIDLSVRAISYSQGNCEGIVCVLMVHGIWDATSLGLDSDEAITIDIPNETSGIRLMILTNSKNLRANLFLINNITGEVETAYKLENVFITN